MECGDLSPLLLELRDVIMECGDLSPLLLEHGRQDEEKR